MVILGGLVKGVGAQCKNRRKAGDYCGNHNTSERRPHGRMDEAVPSHKKPEFKKKSPVLIERPSSCTMPGSCDAMGTAPAAPDEASQIHMGQSSQDSGVPASAVVVTIARRPRVTAAARFREEMRRAMKESLEMGAADVIRRSIEEDAEQKAEYDIATRCVNSRLRAYGLVRCDTPAFGDCQFDAVVMTAGLPENANTFRQRVCNEMERRGIYASDFISYMRKDGNYGNSITLEVIATLLRRPVVVVSNGSEAEAEEEFNPADSTLTKDWGEPLVLAYYIGRHYEGICFFPVKCFLGNIRNFVSL